MSDFWSRRRAQVAAEEQAEAQARELAALQAQQASLEQRPDDELLEELGLPDPDTLKMGDDFSAFLQSSVPSRLRNRALRQLWRSNPVLANLDGLNDYDDDYTDATCVVKNMKTAYQVGKGMLARFEEEAPEQAVEGREEPLAAIEPEEAEAEEPRDEGAGTVDPAAQSAASDEVPDQVRDAAAPYETAQDIQHDIPMARPTRRMRFSFDEAGA